MSIPFGFRYNFPHVFFIHSQPAFSLLVISLDGRGKRRYAFAGLRGWRRSIWVALSYLGAVIVNVSLLGAPMGIEGATRSRVYVCALPGRRFHAEVMISDLIVRQSCEDVRCQGCGVGGFCGSFHRVYTTHTTQRKTTPHVGPLIITRQHGYLPSRTFPPKNPSVDRVCDGL